MKKVTAILLSMLMLLSVVVPFTAFAEGESVAAIGEAEYETLSDAVTAAQPGDTIRLLANITVENSVRVDNENLTIDLNGHILNMDNDWPTLLVAGGHTTVKDSGTDGGIYCRFHDGIAVYVRKGLFTLESGTVCTDSNNSQGDFGISMYVNGENAKVEINGGTVKSASGCCNALYLINGAQGEINGGTIVSTNVDNAGKAITAYANTKLIMTGGEVYASDAGIEAYADSEILVENGRLHAERYGVVTRHSKFTMNDGYFTSNAFVVHTNGGVNNKNSNAYNEIVINGGTLEQLDGIYPAFYLAAYLSSTVINGGKIIGDAGIEVRASDLTVNGGEIVASGPEIVTGTGSSEAYIRSGVGIAMTAYSQGYPASVTVNGGEISGLYAVGTYRPLVRFDNALSLTVTGGSFAGANSEGHAFDIQRFIDAGVESSTITDDVFIVGPKGVFSDTVEDISKYVKEGLYVDEIVEDPVYHSTLGHDWDDGKITTPATCEEDGVFTVTCRNCHSTITSPIPATGHDWDEGEVTAAPGCETEGEMTYICKNDPEHTRTEPIPALGHEWGEWTVTTPVSYGVDGEEERVCARCGEKETRVISVANMTGRKIQFTKMDDMYYVVHMGSHDRWILKEDTRAFDWYDEVELNFEVRLGLGWRLSDYSYKTYVIYLNNKPLEPNEDGTYTIPANIGRAVVTITGASEPTADETPTQFEGKISFWEKIVNFFRMIAETLKNLFK